MLYFFILYLSSISSHRKVVNIFSWQNKKLRSKSDKCKVEEHKLSQSDFYCRVVYLFLRAIY